MLKLLVELDRLSEAKVYLDKVRERAGIPSVDEAWDKYSTNPGYQNTQEGMRDCTCRTYERVIFRRS